MVFLFQLVLLTSPLSARRIRQISPDILGGARLIIYAPDGEELARFNNRGWEIVPKDEKPRRLPAVLNEYLKKYKELRVRIRLNKNGRLYILHQRATFLNQGGKLVDVRLIDSLEEGGTVTDCLDFG